MKTIQSEGGPLLGIKRELAHHWSGISGRNFFGDNSPYEHDYETLCNILAQEKNSPSNIGLISNDLTVAFLITIPDETAIVEAGQDCVYVAQLEAAEPGWSFSMLSKESLADVVYDEAKAISFVSSGSEYILFDSAYDGAVYDFEYLSFTLNEGKYKISFGSLLHQNDAELIIHKIERQPSES